MQLAKVIGDIVVTRKDDNLTGIKLMVLQPIAADGSNVGRTLVAVDAVGAGVGETVFFYGEKMVCELCRPLRRDRPTRDEVVHSSEYELTVKRRFAV